MTSDLTVKDNAQVPSWIKASSEGAGAGLEHVRTQDILIPRIALMQALSPKVADEGKFKPGDLVHSIQDDLLAGPDQPLEFIPIKHYIQWIEWKPRSEGGGIIAQSTDSKSDLARRCAAGEVINAPGKPEDGKPKIVEYHNFVIVVPALGFIPLMVSCGKTNYKHGKNLISRMLMRGAGVPAYAGKYTMQSATEKNRTGQSYKVLKFANAGWATEEEYSKCARVHDMYKDKTVTTNMDDDTGDSESAGVANEVEI